MPLRDIKTKRAWRNPESFAKAGTKIVGVDETVRLSYFSDGRIGISQRDGSFFQPQAKQILHWRCVEFSAEQSVDRRGRTANYFGDLRKRDLLSITFMKIMQNSTNGIFRCRIVLTRSRGDSSEYGANSQESGQIHQHPTGSAVKLFMTHLIEQFLALLQLRLVELQSGRVAVFRAEKRIRFRRQP